MVRKPYKIYWPEKNNFGDILTKTIFKYFDIPYEHNNKLYTVLCIGSIIDKAKSEHIILGSGLLDEKIKFKKDADFRFVRGPLTRQRIINAGGTCPEIYGDPVLLLPLFCDESPKEYDVGIVPHYTDYKYFVEKFPDYKIINVINKDPLEVAREITKCRTIMSSSLHGIICAHAYGIPAAWIRFNKKSPLTKFKFVDYYQSVGLPFDRPYYDLEEVRFHTGTIPNLDPIKEKFLELK